MKSGVWMLDHDSGYRDIKRDLVQRYGKAEAGRIWANAGQRLEGLCARYAHLPEKTKAHTDGQMFRMAALYMALREMHPRDALEILEHGVEREGRKVARLLSVPLRIPGVDRLMLIVFAKMLETSFNEEAGFCSVKHCITQDEVRFDITQCPYCKYLTEIGCPEIIRFSCEIDDCIYGSLPGLEFRRTGTLGKGADKCDFCLRRAEQ